MATFARSTFNAAVYSSFRPRYPAALFDKIYEYHKQVQNARWHIAVDLGCGTGQATTQLEGFTRVLGVDPSMPMIKAAKEELRGLPEAVRNRVRYTQGSAEDLRGVIPDSSVDVAISAQACHWFNWYEVWPEVNRILRPGGTAAFWVYSEFRLTDYPSVSPIITRYAQGEDPETSLGPHFQRPGRTILENHLVDVPDPEEVLIEDNGLTDFQRLFFSGHHHPDLPASQTLPVEMKMEMRWRDLLGYFRTWSSLQTYHEKYPGDLSAVDSRFPEDLSSSRSDAASAGTTRTSTLPALSVSSSKAELDGVWTDDDIDVRGGDIAIRFWKDLRDGVRDAGGQVGVDQIVKVEWPIALLLARKAHGDAEEDSAFDNIGVDAIVELLRWTDGFLHHAPMTRAGPI